MTVNRLADLLDQTGNTFAGFKINQLMPDGALERN